MSKFKVGDHVRILDGQDLPDYVGGWESLEMGRCVGVEAVVDRVERRGDQYGVYLRGTKRSVDFAVRNFVWDERRLEKALHTKDGADQKIVIYRSGRSVIAKDYSTGKIAEAKCSPADKFDFHFGAALAFARVVGAKIKLSDEEESKPEELKYYNGKVVCVERGPGELGTLEATGTYWWTVGKVYDVVNGVIMDDDGDCRGPVKTLGELNVLEDKYAKFIALAGPEPEEPEELKYYNGKVVCIKTGFGACDNVDVTWWTIGKIYDVINGVIRDDDGSPRRPAKSLTELNRITADYAEFIALVE